MKKKILSWAPWTILILVLVGGTKYLLIDGAITSNEVYWVDKLLLIIGWMCLTFVAYFIATFRLDY